MIDAMDQDIDSWCASSIACCDGCFNAYAARWPRAYISANGIQYQAMPADMFYDSARRIQGTVTKSEFLRLLPYVACPNCGGPLGPNLFAFELPFDRKEFQCDLERLAKLADNTPFLLLTDEFASRIKGEIMHLGSVAKSTLPTGLFFRGRNVDASTASRADFEPPPAWSTEERRYNHAGRPTLYLADSHETCWEECRRPRGAFSIATVIFSKPVRLLDLSEPEEMAGVLAPVMYSNLAAAPRERSGWDKPEYVLTRFVADCARFAGMDGIRYCSTRTGSGINVVLFKSDNAMEYVQVVGFDGVDNIRMTRK